MTGVNLYKTEEVRCVQLRGNDIVLHRDVFWKVKGASLGSGTRLEFVLEQKCRTLHIGFNSDSTIKRIAHPVDVDKWLEENDLR